MNTKYISVICIYTILLSNLSVFSANKPKSTRYFWGSYLGSMSGICIVAAGNKLLSIENNNKDIDDSVDLIPFCENLEPKNNTLRSIKSSKTD